MPPPSPSSARSSNSAADEDVLAELQLPHMPAFTRPSANNNKTVSDESAALPTIRILVVADIDLPSASALAEYTLQQKNQVFDATMIDLCIACGPFCRDEDLLPYVRGGRQRRQIAQQQQQQQQGLALPFFRSKEETAALEGLMTASLSQLESIVCRVVYCPGSSDPFTCLETTTTRRRRRLTPNSRNLHQQWLPLAPGLGCAALFYLDQAERVAEQFKKQQRRIKQQQQYNNASSSSLLFLADENNHHQSSGAGLSSSSSMMIPPTGLVVMSPSSPQQHDDFSEEHEDEDEIMMAAEELLRIQQSAGYSLTLDRLLKLAPNLQESSSQIPFCTSIAQSILVTHYVDGGGATTTTASSSFNSGGGAPPPTTTTTPEEERPWPKEGHNELDSCCLEIASGCSERYAPEWIPRENDKGEEDKKKRHSILVPGSLRKRGEFCIVEVSLLMMHNNKCTWSVNKVDFHELNRFPPPL